VDFNGERDRKELFAGGLLLSWLRRICLMRFAILTLFCVCIYGQGLRIVSFTSPSTETLYAIGAERDLVGVTDVSVFPEQVEKDKASGRVVVVGRFSDFDSAKLAALRPTLILTGTGFQKKLSETLTGRGYRVLHSDPHSLEEVFTDLIRIGEACGRGLEAKRLVGRMRAEKAAVERVSLKLPKVRLYLEMNHVGPWTNGAGSVLEDLVRAAGGENVFGDDPRSVFQTTNEEVARRNPEVILSPIWVKAKLGGLDGITPLAEIFSRPALGMTTAILNSRVHYYDSALLKHTGPRQVLAIRKLAQLLHPESFGGPPLTIPWELGRIRP
jgi:iron complex transport system substrate-binding protein